VLPSSQMHADGGTLAASQRALATAVEVYELCEGVACATPAASRPSLLGRVAWWAWNRRAAFVIPAQDASHHPGRTCAMAAGLAMSVGAVVVFLGLLARGRRPRVDPFF
jgi:hypothetical protein